MAGETVWRCRGCGIVRGLSQHSGWCPNPDDCEEVELHPEGTGKELARLRELKRLIWRMGKASERTLKWLEGDDWPEETPEEELARLREALTQIVKRDDWTAGEARHCARVALGEEP